MGTDKPTILNIETLNALGARLFDHAETVAVAVELDQVAIDLKLAARACSKFATFRFAVSEIASDATTPPATRRDLLIALEEAQRPEPPADWPEGFSRSSHHSS